MDWKLNLLIGIGMFTLVASIIGSLEQILRFLSWMVRPMLKRYLARKGTWPLKVTIRSASLGGTTSIPSIMVVLLVEPRKPVFLGRCEIVYNSNPNPQTPITPIEMINDFQEWKVGDYLDKPRTYILSFYAFGVENSMQIKIESEGYECKSNLINIT